MSGQDDVALTRENATGTSAYMDGVQNKDRHKQPLLFGTTFFFSRWVILDQNRPTDALKRPLIRSFLST